MSKRKVNTAYYRGQILKRSQYAPEMKKAVDLYEESKIEREATLKNIFILLKSRGEKNQKKGVELLNKLADAEPAKGKIKRLEGPKRDNLMKFDGQIRATALNEKVKEVDIHPRHLGEEAKTQIRRIYNK